MPIPDDKPISVPRRRLGYGNQSTDVHVGVDDVRRPAGYIEDLIRELERKLGPDDPDNNGSDFKSLIERIKLIEKMLGGVKIECTDDGKVQLTWG